MSTNIAEEFSEAADAVLVKASDELRKVVDRFDDQINELEEKADGLNEKLLIATEDLEPVQKALARLIMAVEDHVVRELVDRDELLEIAGHCENLEAMAGVTI